MDHEDDDTVSFNLKDTWHFNQKESGSLTGDEMITIPHVLLLVRSAALRVWRNASSFIKLTDRTRVHFIHLKSAVT